MCRRRYWILPIAFVDQVNDSRCALRYLNCRTTGTQSPGARPVVHPARLHLRLCPFSLSDDSYGTCATEHTETCLIDTVQNAKRGGSYSGIFLASLERPPGTRQVANPRTLRTRSFILLYYYILLQAIVGRATGENITLSAATTKGALEQGSSPRPLSVLRTTTCS